MDSEENKIPSENTGNEPSSGSGNKGKVLNLSGMYQNWFLDYASYVILERAVPDIADGAKPVQRRILHSMFELEDGRYNKVANIIGNTMKYHPHGDASIGDALVQLGQKDILIDMQGNWGNILTGDSAAAPRYIEARLSKFALDVVFNPKTTEWKLSYDGRNREPVHLPIKFPLLLAQGAEGIAVGLSVKILPHNFNELLDACVAILKNQDFVIYPDFPTGGFIDVSRYKEGERSGKVRVRAKITELDKKTLVITEIPFGTTTGSLIDSILSANDSGKIKIRKIEDNTASNVEVQVHLAPNVTTDQMIDALYAFTDCEVSISPICCVIDDNNPIFTNINTLLRNSVTHTQELLTLELEIRRKELQESHLFSSLEKIFIENRIYRDIEECTTWESVIETIDQGLEPYKAQFYREITNDDVAKLTEIRIKRISKYDAFKADEIIRQIELELGDVQQKLDNIVEYTIEYYKNIKKKYGKGRERKTEIRNFENIEAAEVAVANQKLYVNREEGFLGYGLKKDEFVCDCSDLDDIIAFKQDGTFVVTKITEKIFVGKNIIHIDVFKKNDDRTIYNAVYRDGSSGAAFVKRFFVKGVTRDKEYTLTKGTPNSRVLYFTPNPNGEAEVINIQLVPRPKLKKAVFDFNFADIAIKGRQSMGNLLTKYLIRKISLKDTGVSTLGGVRFWFDDTVKRLTTEENGRFLGEFNQHDRLILLTGSGYYRIFKPDTQLHFEDEILFLEKYNKRHVFTLIYENKKSSGIHMKRFIPEEIPDRRMEVVQTEEGDIILHFSAAYLPRFELIFDSKKMKKTLNPELINAEEFAGIKSFRAKGKKLSSHPIKKINEIEALEASEEWLEKVFYVEETESSPENKENQSGDDSDTEMETGQFIIPL